jgi:mitochondrial fission protein ELM1
MSDSSANRLRVAVLLDGRPGHEKQTKGILQAMQSMAELEAIPLHVERVGPLALLWRTFLLFLPGKGPSVPSVAKADLLLGTGSRTHLPLLAIKKRYGIPAITCMKPPLHLRSRFDLCFVPEHDGISEQGNIMLTSGAPNCSIDRDRHQAGYGLILLGGIDRKSHDWHSDRICMMVKRIVETESMTHWTISSSPRTPQETILLLERLAGDAKNVDFFHYQNTEPGWIEEQYDRNSVVWVTADSISMVYEALTAGCKVGILPMQWKRKNSKFKKNEDLLVQKGLVVSYPAWVTGGCSWREDIELNEALRCAERILRKWLPKS